LTQEAIDTYVSMYESDTSDVSVLKKVSDIYVEDGKYESSSLILAKALQVDQTNISLLVEKYISDSLSDPTRMNTLFENLLQDI
jgi:hypothetical protein